MEVRYTDKEIGRPDSFDRHHVPNREASQALDQNHLYHQLKPSQESQYPRRDPDPVSAAEAIGQNLRALTSVPQSTSGTDQPSVQYRECQKNHAANVGGHVVDGCGEFMPGGEEGTPEALKCAACECHRSFHRKESNAGNHPYYNSYSRSNGRRETMSVVQQPPHLPRQHHHNHHRYSHTAPMAPTMMAFGGGSGVPADSSSEDLNMFHSNLEAQTYMHPHKSKKRYRTKFSQEQKDKMMEFAEKLDWKLQKQDEQQLQQFCTEVGVKRQVFKVWLHNNKQAMKKKTQM